MKKIFFDEQGYVGTIQGENLLPVKENEKMVCTESEAAALGLNDGQWIEINAVKNLPNTHANVAYDILKGTGY
jgi:hypothetical protein